MHSAKSKLRCCRPTQRYHRAVKSCHLKISKYKTANFGEALGALISFNHSDVFYLSKPHCYFDLGLPNSFG